MMRWGMVIDLKKCVGCYSCTVACKEEHYVPPGVFFNKVLITHIGKYPAVTKEILPVLCNHCKDSPCVKACPTGASIQREDGIVYVDSDKCMGCRYCVVVCPYQQRTFFDHYTDYFNGYGPTPPRCLAASSSPTRRARSSSAPSARTGSTKALQEALPPASTGMPPLPA